MGDSNISSGKIIKILKKDEDKCLLDYTNRRKLKICDNDDNDNKNSEVRKMENEKEYESLCTKIEECSVSKIPLVGRAGSKRSSSASTTASVSSAASSSASDTSVNHLVHKDVEAFQKFLNEKGGHYGGWKVKDHLFFVKTVSKYPSSKAAEIVNENFPDIPVEKVQGHEVWYKEYVRLRLANKRAVEEWKKAYKPAVKVKQKEADPPEQRIQSALARRDPKLKQKIEIWKAQTLAAKMRRLEEHEKEELRKKKEEEEKKRIQEEKRAMVNRYREEKLSYEMAMQTAKEMEDLQVKKESVEKTALLLKYFRYEDRRFTERQKAKLQQKQKGKEEIKPKKLVEVKRDPNRLLKPTQGWIHHTKKSEQAEGNTPAFIQHLSKLRKPTWREGLSS